ncbi:glycoside hydrolase family 55 protein [Planctomicrobium piriforme]|nr:glycoside hydrolase family 55 protein [Planctomicrobium piriforme]
MFLSVLDFGAVGDGVANDAPAIQATITAAQAAKCDVWIPAGTYLLKQTLTLPESMGIYGRGVTSYWDTPVDGTILRRSGTLKAHMMVCSGVNRIDGICFDGGAHEQTGLLLPATEDSHGRYNVINACTFLRHNIGIDGQYHGHESTITNCRFHQLQIGIRDIADSRVSGCCFNTCKKQAVHFRSSDNQISNSTVEFGGGFLFETNPEANEPAHDNSLSGIRFDRTEGPAVEARGVNNLLIGPCQFQRSASIVRGNPLRNTHILLIDCVNVTINPGMTRTGNDPDRPAVTPLHTLAMRGCSGVDFGSEAWMSGCMGNSVYAAKAAT